MAYRISKRCFDIVVSGLSLIVLFPFFILIALVIVCTSKGGVFFRQERVGKDFKNFKIIKFRTMYHGSDKAQGPQITPENDMRITKVGRVLRKFKLDELPQLINVFIGQMSFVGPRPIVPRYVAMYTEEQKKILSVRPGITDFASLRYVRENELLSGAEDAEELYLREIMPDKIKLNLEYLEKRSFWLDLKLIFLTVISIFKRG